MKATKKSAIYANLLSPKNISLQFPNVEIKNLFIGDVIIDKIYFSQFLARFIAGNENLKKLRGISRNKLALAASGIGYFKTDEQALLKQIQQYVKAENYLFTQDEITLINITKTNKMLTSEHKRAGKIRTTQNWIGGKTIKKAAYICPPPTQVNNLLKNWLEFINDEKISIGKRIIIGYSYLILIHPFSDGNGRTARALLGALLKKHFGLYVNPILYRIHSKAVNVSANEYINAIHSFHKSDKKIVGYHSFWYESFQWANDVQQAINILVQQVKNKINNAIMLVNLSPQALILIDYLWKQPVICEKGLAKEFNWDINIIQSSLAELLSLGLIEPKKLRSIKDSIVFSCPIILDVWAKMDDIICQPYSFNAESQNDNKTVLLGN